MKQFMDEADLEKTKIWDRYQLTIVSAYSLCALIMSAYAIKYAFINCICNYTNYAVHMQNDTAYACHSPNNSIVNPQELYFEAVYREW